VLPSCSGISAHTDHMPDRNGWRIKHRKVCADGGPESAMAGQRRT
jgi:hypothetical protein